MNDFLKLEFWRKHGLNFLLVSLSLLALGIAMLLHSRADEALQFAKSSYQQQQAINAEAEQSAALLKEFLPVYKTFQEQGFIGPPQRLQWLEALNENVSQHRVPLVTFSLSPTTVGTSTNTTYAPDILILKVTPMRLDFTLLHEGDFYRLLSMLQQRAKGLFSAESCEIHRTEGASDDDILNSSSANTILTKRRIIPRFKGQCELLWYSLTDITQAWEVPDEQ
ncbi:MAG: hypothetical protein V4660_11515 [Pseudomonadota bacterium]